MRELVRPMTEQGDASALMQAIDGEPSYLFLAVKQGSVEVVRALLEAGGRELVMMTRNNGVSCLMISAQNGHLEVVRALLEAGGRELLMLTMNNASSCLYMRQYVARRANQGEVFRVLEVACQNAGLSSHEITILKR